MSKATATSHDTGRQPSPRGLHREAQQPATRPERNAAQRLGTTSVPVRLAFTWLGVRQTLAPEQCTIIKKGGGRFNIARVCRVHVSSKLVDATQGDARQHDASSRVTFDCR
jgi:hypothetical protein